MTANPKRRWYQYSLRSMFILTTLVAIACSWYAYEMNEAAKRRTAIDEIEKLGGEVGYADGHYVLRSTRGEPPAWYCWLRHLHGDEYLGNATFVELGSVKVTDDALVHMRALPRLEYLGLGWKQLTDEGVENLQSALPNCKIEYNFMPVH